MSLVARRPSPFPGNETILCNNDVSMANGQINFMFAQGYRRNCTGKRFPSSSINNSSTHSLVHSRTLLLATGRNSLSREAAGDGSGRVTSATSARSTHYLEQSLCTRISCKHFACKKMCTFHLMQLHYDSTWGPTCTRFDAEAE